MKARPAVGGPRFGAIADSRFTISTIHINCGLTFHQDPNARTPRAEIQCLAKGDLVVASYSNNKSVLFEVRSIVNAADLSPVIDVGKFGKDGAWIGKVGKSM